LTFGRFKISEIDTINADIDNLFSEFQKNKVEDESIEMMRTGTLFLILKIIKSSKIEIKGELGKQAIRDAIYYSQIIHQKKVNKIDFEVLEPFRKFWEVYVHNLYYISTFDRILSIIIHITKRNPLGISIDGISNKISLEIIIKTINNLGIDVHPSESILDVYSKLSKKLNKKNTTLESSINENKILKKLVRSKDISESVAGILILFLLCKYRYSSFDKKQLETLSYKQDPVVNIHPSKMYADIEQNTISEFIGWVFSYVIKRHSYISMKKMQLMREQGQGQGQGPEQSNLMQGQGPGHSSLIQERNNSDNGEIFMDEVKIDENKDDSIHDSIDDSIHDSIDDIHSTDNEEIKSNIDDDNQSIMTIELDNKFKHLSVKELKELCKENNLSISGNKSTLASRLFENDGKNDVENI